MHIWKTTGDFLTAVAGAPCFHCWGPGFIPASRKYNLTSCLAWPENTHTHTHIKLTGIIITGLPWRLRQWRTHLQCGRLGISPWSGRSPGEGNGNPLQSSCLEDPMDRGAWRATVCGISNCWTQLSTHTQMPWLNYLNSYSLMLSYLLGLILISMR